MPKRYLLITLLFVMATTLRSNPASASPVAIVDTLAPGFVLTDLGVGGPLDQWIAVEFSVTQSWVITGVNGWINPTVSGDLRFRLYSDGGDVPGVALFDQLLPIDGAAASAWYGPSGLSWSIGPGSYWLAFESPNTFIGGMPIPSINSLVNSAYRTSVVPSYTANDNFRHIGVQVYAEAADAAAVPEPASVVLLGTGLVGFVAARRYRSRERV